MKLMIASDIHGSAYYCRKMLEAFEQERADRLLLLGDILYHGPRNDLPKDYAPKEVIAMLNPRKESILCVRGNCDTEVDQMVLEFPILAEYCLLELDGQTIFATHGHVWNPKHPPMLKRGDILLNGHTHIPACARFAMPGADDASGAADGSDKTAGGAADTAGGYVYMNPGSVSIPKENSAHSYMIYQNKTFEWKDLEEKDLERKVYNIWKTDLHS